MSDFYLKNAVEARMLPPVFLDLLTQTVLCPAMRVMWSSSGDVLLTTLTFSLNSEMRSPPCSPGGSWPQMGPGCPRSPNPRRP